MLYEDGVEVARSTTITTLPSAIGNGTTTADYIGHSMYTSDRYLKGSVRDFRIYDRALTAAEVSALGAISDADRVARDAAALSLPETTTADLTLPTSGPNGSTIAWASDTPAVISATGKVVRAAADATVTLTATVTHGGATQLRTFAVHVPARLTDAAAAQEAAAALTVWDADDVRGNVTLPTTGANGATVSWSSSDAAVVTPTGEVTRGDAAKAVTLTANVRVGDATVERAFNVTVRAKAVREPYAGYAFSYFTGEGSANGEQIYFAASRGNDPLHWDELNGGQPALTSQFGDKGVRDPFIIRSPEGDKFFLIATDLKIYGNGNWDAAQRTGSKYIEVWESTDLVHWSDQRHVRVSPDTAGNTWAPEAYYDDALGAYVVFWASKLYDPADTGHTGNTYNRMLYATTRDFRTFSEPKVWVDPGYSVIDSTVIKHGPTYYRFTKDERNNTSSTPCSKFIVEQKATSLLDLDWDFVADCIGKANADGPGIGQGEGPTIFKSNTEDRWYLFIDEFGGRGYVPFESTNLDSGRWKLASGYELPARPRHGTVLPVTQAELARLRNEPDPVRATPAGLVASYGRDGSGTTLADRSGNGYDAVLNGDVTRGEDALTFGGTDGYVKLPDNLMAGLDAISVATEVWIDPAQATPYFIYGLGNTSGNAGNGYLFTTGNGYRTAITAGDYTREQTVGAGDLSRGGWHQLTYTLSAGTAILYLDGVEVARNSGVTVRPRDIGLGRTTANYIGRSLYSSDRYLKGRVKSFAIYNRALSAAEVGALPGNAANITGVELAASKVPPLIDAAAGTVLLRVKPGTDLAHLAPRFTVAPGATVVESGERDFEDRGRGLRQPDRAVRGFGRTADRFQPRRRPGDRPGRVHRRRRPVVPDWGNGNAYVAPLNADMVSIDVSKRKRLTGLTGFREGLFMHKRAGVYYLSWSIDDTRSENYRVGYATATSPMGDGLVNRGEILNKDPSLGILGTGHHSVIQIPDTDDWYIAYHRFGIPGGDGTHREVTIDRLYYNADGTIKRVVPTLEGVAPLPTKVEAPGGVGGTVPATLSLTLGPPASFGTFVPGVAREYTASTTANVVSTAGDAALTVSERGHLVNGSFALPEPLAVEIAPAAWTLPVSNAAVAIAFRQKVGATDPLRTGIYSRALTFTLSTTTP